MVLAHVFFNVALVARLLLQGWLAIPAEQFRLAAQLGFGPRDVFRRIEAPMLREVLPGAFVLVFLLCMTSFAVALTLGGGPRATTVELAIYQAVRFDFDLGRAAWLALIQFALCGARGAGGAAAVAPTPASAAGSAAACGAGTPTGRACGCWTPRCWWRWRSFSGCRSAAVAVRGMRGAGGGAARRGLAGGGAQPRGGARLGGAGARRSGWRSRRWSMRGGRAAAGGWIEAAGLMTLAASPFVIGTGLFILLYPLADPFALALPVTATVNAAMALPFVLRALLPALTEARTRGRAAGRQPRDRAASRGSAS